MQKVIVIPDSFKGSMTSQEVTDILAGSIEEHLKCEVVRLPIADGGEGSMDCILRAKGGSRKTVTVHSPEGRLRQPMGFFLMERLSLKLQKAAD